MIPKPSNAAKPRSRKFPKRGTHAPSPKLVLEELQSLSTSYTTMNQSMAGLAEVGGGGFHGELLGGKNLWELIYV